MDDNLVNANPTILNAADLPSRRRESPSSKKRRGLFDELFSPSSDVTPVAAFATPAAYSGDGENSIGWSESDSETAKAERQLYEEIDAQEVYDLIAPISDPEHPLSLGSLGVVTLEDITVEQHWGRQRGKLAAVRVLLTPTTSACSLTTVIGLGVKVRLLQALPPRFRVDVRIKPGTSKTADEVNKQLGDKERIAAAMENRNLAAVVGQMLSTCD